jgi:hypothetical protein
MTGRGIGTFGWLLVSATAAGIVALSVLAVRGFVLDPTQSQVGVGLLMGVIGLTISTIWYLWAVAWKREIRHGEGGETREVAQMATAEALLRLVDHVDGVLDRLTKYMGWFFVLVVLSLLFVPLLFTLGFFAWLQPGWIAVLFGAGNLFLWIVYFYFYYKIKNDNDLWKERLAWLREREKALLER